MCGWGERRRSIRAEGTEAEIWKAIPAGQARVGGSKKQATQKVTAFVETVEMTSITRDLEHITFCAPGNKLGLAVDTFPLCFAAHHVGHIQTFSNLGFAVGAHH